VVEALSTDRPLHLYDTCEDHVQALALGRHLAHKYRVETLVVDCEVFLVEPPPQLRGYGFVDAWRDGQLQQGLLTVEELGQALDERDPQYLYDQWRQEQADQAERDRELDRRWALFRGRG
jgi:hypothetical protein